MIALCLSVVAILTHLRERIMLVALQIWGWLMRRPEVWRFVGLASTVGGLVCYALSSAFNHLFGKWYFWKIFLYIVVSVFICLLTLFPDKWQRFLSPWFKTHSPFWVLTITSAYSFFFDKAVSGKSDIYNLISCAAFAIMSLSLSRRTHCGLEKDLLYFFLGVLIVRLMMIKISLGVVGVCFGYFLHYLYTLPDHPIIIVHGTKSFQLDKRTGKKCYMVSAGALSICWVETPEYWYWTTLPESRFQQVAVLRDVCWFDIRGTINTLELSSNTHYAAYLVFNMIDPRGFYHCPVELSLGIIGGPSSTKNVCLDPYLEESQLDDRFQGLQRPNVRNDGLLEIEMGEFFNSGIGDEVHMRVCETQSNMWKSGFLLEGIEVRPRMPAGTFEPTVASYEPPAFQKL